MNLIQVSFRLFFGRKTIHQPLNNLEVRRLSSSGRWFWTSEMDLQTTLYPTTKKGLPRSAGPLYSLVAGKGFEPLTFGL